MIRAEREGKKRKLTPKHRLRQLDPSLFVSGHTTSLLASDTEKELVKEVRGGMVCMCEAEATGESENGRERRKRGRGRERERKRERDCVWNFQCGKEPGRKAGGAVEGRKQARKEQSV